MNYTSKLSNLSNEVLFRVITLRNKQFKCRSSLYLSTSFSSKTTPFGLPNLAGRRKYGFLKKVEEKIVNYYQNFNFNIEKKLNDTFALASLTTRRGLPGSVSKSTRVA